MIFHTKRQLCLPVVIFLLLEVRVFGAGKLLGFVGISGIGKSTMVRSLGEKINTPFKLEPEESAWPIAVFQKDKFGAFTALMAFRQMWIQQLISAQEIKSSGQNVFIDTFFIKLLKYELGDPGIEWLIRSDDIYFNALKTVVDLDVANLPDPDVLVLFDVSFEDWFRFVKARHRKFDENEQFISSFNQMKELLERATVQLCSERNIRLLKYTVMYGNIPSEVDRLYRFLLEMNVLTQ